MPLIYFFGLLLFWFAFNKPLPNISYFLSSSFKQISYFSIIYLINYWGMYKSLKVGISVLLFILGYYCLWLPWGGDMRVDFNTVYVIFSCAGLMMIIGAVFYLLRVVVDH